MLNRRSFLGAGSLAMLAAGCPTVSSAASACEKACAKKKVPFKLGAAGYTYHRCSLDETLKSLKSMDINYLCIKDFHLPYNSNAQQIKAFHQKCADHGVTGYGVGPIYFEAKDARKYFDYAKAVGVKILVAVPFEWGDVKGSRQRCASRACCEEAAKLCKEYDIKVAIHNHGPEIPHCFPTGDTAFEMVKDLDPRMGLCLDIGHNFRFGLDPVESIHKLRSRIFDMHIKNVKFHSQHNLARPMPRGDMDMWKIVKALCDINYTGVCSLEYEAFPHSGTNFQEIAESYGYFKGLMKAAEG